MIKVASRFLVILLAFGCLYPSFAQKPQNDGLTFTGSVQSIKINDLDGRRNYSIVVRIQFRNDSDVKLMIPDLRYATRTVRFVYQSMGSGSRPPDENEKVVAAFSIMPKIPDLDYFRDYDWLGNWIKRLDEPTPQNAPVITLEPGMTIEMSDTIDLEQKFILDGPADDKRKVWEGFSDGKKAGIPLSDLPAFTLEYHFAIGKSYKNPDLLTDLRDRWKRYGHLIVDGNGNFTITSQRIINSDGR